MPIADQTVHSSLIDWKLTANSEHKCVRDLIDKYWGKIALNACVFRQQIKGDANNGKHTDLQNLSLAGVEVGLLH